MSDIELTEEQVAIVCAPTDAQLAVAASAGSAKTTVLTLRASALVASGVEPSNILVLAFTRAAAAIAASRIHPITPGVMVSTIHGVCLYLLQERAANLFDQGILPMPKFAVATELEWDRVRKAVAREQNRGMSNERVMTEARRRMHAAGLLPVDELLSRGDQAIRARGWVPWTHLLVDEAQDLSTEQWDVLEALDNAGATAVTFVGDTAQAIYGFLGADAAEFSDCIRLAGEAGQALTLSKNWRSRPEIIDLANKILEHMDTNTPVMVPGRVVDEIDPETVQLHAFPTEEAELDQAVQVGARLAQDRPVAVLARYREQVKEMQRLCEVHGIEYWMPGASHSIWNSPGGEVAVTALRAIFQKRDGDLERLLKDSWEEEPEFMTEARAQALKDEEPLLDVLVFRHGEAMEKFDLVWWPAVLQAEVGDLDENVEAALDAMMLSPELILSCSVWCRTRGPGPQSVDDFLRHLPLMGPDDDVPITNLCLSTIHGCVAGDTIVETPDGLRRMSEVPAAGTIGTPTGAKSYSGKFTRHGLEALKITTRSGYHVIVSPEHGLTTWAGGDVRREAWTLKEGSLLRLRLGAGVDAAAPASLPAAPETDVRARKHIVPTHMSLELAEFLGLMVADGTVFHAGFRLVKRYESVTQRFADLCASLFGATVHHVDGHGCNGFEVCSTELAAWLLSLGGLAPRAKAVPESVLSSPLQMHRAFLRGLFEDGTVNEKDGRVDHVHLDQAGATGQAMLSLVHVMLLRTGIVSSVRQRASATGHGLTTLYIYGQMAAEFGRQIGFVSPEKNARLDGAFGENTHYLIPVTKDEVGECAEWLTVSARQNARRRGTMSRHTAQEVLRLSGGLPWLAERMSWHYEPIRSMEPIECETMCVEVPDGNRFLQNGFDGWNSKGGEWSAVIVTGLNEGRLPGRSAAIEEERRLFYVACTRAKDLLVLTCHHSGLAFDGRPARRHPSRFLKEVGLG